VTLDDGERKIVAGNLRPDGAGPELRQLANDPHHIRGLFERLNREGWVKECSEAPVWRRSLRNPRGLPEERGWQEREHNKSR
jgi:hypothetical protein